MNISNAGINLIKEFEGVRLRAYRDAVGVLTIGYGHTKGVQPGMAISMDEAETFLRQDLDTFEHGVSKAVLVPVSQPQFDALVSFAFNVGLGALGRSTLLRMLNKGDYAGAADQFLRWDKAGGRVLAGLQRRRQAERGLFLSTKAPAASYESAQPSDPDLFDLLGVIDLRGTAHEDEAKRLQRAVGTVPDAILGPVTWGKLIDLEMPK